MIDVAIVGAGAAGIAAARRLADQGRDVLLIEALPRLGGRAHSVAIGGMAVDLGCGWLHSAERNPLASLAEAEGVAIERGEAAWGKQLRNLGFPACDQHEAWAAYEALLDRLHSDPPASDCAGDAIAPDDRWRPFADALSSYMNGCELDRLSVADFLAYDDHATERNWRLPGGYGAFVAGLGARVPASLDTPVTAIREEGELVLETPRGDIRAKAAIVTVSTGMLARGAIRFGRGVEDHLHAASKLPLGLADKVLLSIADPEAVPAESHLLGATDTAATGSYYLRPFGRPLVECFLAGTLAAELEAAGEGAAFDFVRGQLRDLLGADFAKGLGLLAATRWRAEPTIGGSYSHALPGHADARAVLAGPVSERLCFAGEACSAHDFSTAHGAWTSGLEAAVWIGRHLPT